MGGKSRKTGQISKKLIDKIKYGKIQGNKVKNDKCKPKENKKKGLFE